MLITPVKLPLLQPPKDDLFKALEKTYLELKENSVVAVSSKVVAVHQGRCVELGSVSNRDELITKEAELYLERDQAPHGFMIHTVKNYALVGSAGIDKSNAGDHYVLLPTKPTEFAAELHTWLRRRYGVKNLGVLITDSHSIPLRRGTMGVSIAHCGFKPIYDYRGQADLFDRELKVSLSNLADGMAAAATLVMGEGNEQTPLAVIEDVKKVEFIDGPYEPHDPFQTFYIDPEDDLYRPLFKYLPWKHGGSGKGSKNP